MVTNHAPESLLQHAHPDMHWRLNDFVEDYAIGEKPALIWQWRPADTVEVDVSASAVRDLVSRGAPSSKSQAWWYGFRSTYGLAQVFAGLSSTDPANASGCAAEVHTDGHLIAGLWNFPTLAVNERPTPCLSDFHRDAFRDFADLAEATAAAISYTGPSRMTATLLAAKSLVFVRGGNFWGHHGRRPTRTTLQWRLRTSEGPQLRAIGEAMVADYERAFGL